MGNCGLRVASEGAEGSEMVKVVTRGGGVMELRPPVTAECITNGFPGHALFHGDGHDIFSRPVLHNEELVGGEFYHLRPLNLVPEVHGVPSLAAPYRVSMGHRQWNWKKHAEEAAVPKIVSDYNVRSGGSSGLWRVKLVISPAQLNEILAQETRTKELIESVRTVAKCATGGTLGSLSLTGSDLWSHAGSSRRGSSMESMGQSMTERIKSFN